MRTQQLGARIAPSVRGNRNGLTVEMGAAHAPALDDEALIRLVAAGKARALEVLFDRHGSAAFSLALRICRTQARAEDVVQEAFLSLWRGAATYQPDRGTVRTWLMRIVHNRAIDTIRRNSERDRRDVHDEGTAERIAGTELTERDVLQAEEARGIRAALAQLPAEQRQVIDLAYFDGLTHTEIARLLGLPAGTVKGRMRLGLKRLRALLTADEDDVDQREVLVAGA